MNVLIIPEDFRKDQYIVKPLIRKMLGVLGKANSNVRVCLDPLLGGIGEALKWQLIKTILERYKDSIDLFLLLVDRDGNTTRRFALDGMEGKANQFLGDGKLFLAEHAWQEIEVWALAGLPKLPPKWNWQEIREELHPKEVYFEPHAKERGLINEPGQGRTTLGREAANNYKRVRSRCPEDIASLETRLKLWLNSA